MTEFNRTGFTSIKAGDKRYWFPVLPAEEKDRVKVLLPTGDSDFTLIDSLDSLVNWFFKAFPNAVIEEVIDVGPKPEPVEKEDIKCPKCGCTDCRKNGFSSKNLQRYLCKHCHKTFLPKGTNSAVYDPANT